MKKELSQKELAAKYIALKKHQREYAQRPEVKKRAAEKSRAYYQSMRKAYLAQSKK